MYIQTPSYHALFDFDTVSPSQNVSIITAPGQKVFERIFHPPDLFLSTNACHTGPVGRNKR
jgi:hypothetical protein